MMRLTQVRGRFPKANDGHTYALIVRFQYDFCVNGRAGPVGDPYKDRMGHCTLEKRIEFHTIVYLVQNVASANHLPPLRHQKS